MRDILFTYFPLLETLQILFENEEIYHLLERTPSGHSVHFDDDLNCIEDLCCGSLSVKHHFIVAHPTCLKFIIYYDELTFSNPLGAAAINTKYGVFYFTLGNFPPSLRSHLDFIFLLGIGRAADLKGAGIEDMLKPLVAELKLFSRGVTMKVAGQSKKIFGFPLLFLGDTRAANHLFGLKEGVGTSFRKCLQCFASRDDMCTKVDLTFFRKRKLEDHLVAASQIEMEGKDSGKTSMETGITRLSSLFSLSACCNFQPFEQCPDDVMHVLFEGIVPYVIKKNFCLASC